MIAEGQFSNYPFFFNNVFRTHVFYKSGIEFPAIGALKGAVIITKARLFPASNSTLYYEQALKQMNFLIKVGVPHRGNSGRGIRLIGRNHR